MSVDPAEELRRRQAAELARLAQAAPLPVSLRGVLSRAELESGPWLLTTADQRSFELVGVPDGDPGGPGHEVEVTGRLVSALTSSQVGPVVEVLTLRRLEP